MCSLFKTEQVLFFLQAEAVEKSKPLFESAVQHYQDAIELLPEEERNKPIKQQVAGVSISSHTLGIVIAYPDLLSGCTLLLGYLRIHSMDMLRLIDLTHVCSTCRKSLQTESS